MDFRLLWPNSTSFTYVLPLNKKEALAYPIKVDYACFDIPNKFVVGYGLDYEGLGRNTKAIYQLK